MDESSGILIVATILIAAAVAILPLNANKTPQHTSILTGAKYYEEVMESESEQRFLTVARMPKFIFLIFLSNKHFLRYKNTPCNFICCNFIS